MILYFSGTGNSRMVAERLEVLLNERTFCMEEGVEMMPKLGDDEVLGAVFPVYAWGLPGIVRRFVEHISVGERYVWTVMTCGDDMGYADRILEGALHRKVDAAFSVQMPNTYVCLPGFDVDAAELAERKLEATKGRMPGIAERIGRRERCRELTRGAAAWLKTYVLRSVFNNYLVTDRYFKTNSRCTACGLCAKQCPTKDIEMVSGVPTWQHKSCCGCLRCYHSCPQRSIDWGKYTKGKGQKINRNF